MLIENFKGRRGQINLFVIGKLFILASYAVKKRKIINFDYNFVYLIEKIDNILVVKKSGLRRGDSYDFLCMRY